MTRPSLAGIEKRAAAATAELFEVTHGPRERARVWIEDDTEPFAEFAEFAAPDDARLFAHARTDLDALTAAVRDVLALHAPFEWSFGQGPVRSCRECTRLGASEEDSLYPCPTVRALATHLDLTDPEGEPT